MRGRGEKGKEETKGKSPANEIRVNAVTYVRTYLAYIARLFQENHDDVIIRGMGQAIPRAVGLSMLVRKRFKGLHQLAKVETAEFDDRGYVRRVGLITIKLSKNPLDKDDPGYSPPLPDSEVTEYVPFAVNEKHDQDEAPRRSRGRGGRVDRQGGSRRGRRGGSRQSRGYRY
eukprot:TRINITY_DN11108_c0_g1_i27.p1 TRINITY_DN11108_c0_g1~~TRINITY_DN11108_c0_g1_i27.p1  ORF type:complete len:172 (-),score=46.38 TRINITY_DN11108_c0_g1_i27:133-648(-)